MFATRCQKRSESIHCHQTNVHRPLEISTQIRRYAVVPLKISVMLMRAVLWHVREATVNIYWRVSTQRKVAADQINTWLSRKWTHNSCRVANQACAKINPFHLEIKYNQHNQLLRTHMYTHQHQHQRTTIPYHQHKRPNTCHPTNKRPISPHIHFSFLPTTTKNIKNSLTIWN